MNKTRFPLILTLILLPGATLWATLTWAAPSTASLSGGAPAVVAYQGEVRLGGSPFTGEGYFKFAVVDATGTTTYWSNDGTGSGGGAPSTAVQSAANEGLFAVLLGDTTVTGMTQPLTAEVFSQPGRYLRVWFSADAGGPFEPLAPDTRVAAVPYALQAEEAADADMLDGLHANAFAAEGHDHWGESWTGIGTGLTLSGGSKGLYAAGTSSGVYGITASDTGHGVYGEATANSGITCGVYGVSNSPGGYGVRGYNDASSGNSPGVYGSSPVSPDGRGVYGYGMGYGVYGETWNGDGYALYGEAMATSGTSYGVYGESNSSNGYGGYFVNSGSDGIALYATGSGSGSSDATLRVDNTEPTGGVAAYLSNDSNYGTAKFQNAGSGEVLYLQNGGDASGVGGGDFIKAVNESESDVQFRVSSGGFVYADGGYRCGNSISNDPLVSVPPGFFVYGLNEGSIDPCLRDDSPADFAEMFPATGSPEPGDVLAIGPDGQLTLSSEPYQTSIAGVYSYRPSFLGNAQYADDEGYVPLALLGVVPVKASAENGRILPGDLLVAASIPGHAMRAGENPPQGAVIGKALERLEEGAGFIQMLVTLQ
jgi:hypothetical protein